MDLPISLSRPARRCSCTALLLLVIVAATPGGRTAQAADDTPDRSLPEVVFDDLVIFLDDNLHFFSAPLRWNDRDWLHFGGLAGSQVIQIAAIDDWNRDIWLPRNSDPLMRDLMEVSGSIGNIFYATIATSGIYTTGLFSGDEDIRVTGRILTETMFWSGLMAITLRVVAGRSRPAQLNGPHEFNFFQTSRDIQSYPSGHTTVAFALATVFAGRIDEPWAYASMYSAAGLMALSRFYFDHHWLSDVTLGAVIGISSGLHALQREAARQNPDRLPPRISVQPGLGGVRLSYRLD